MAGGADDKRRQLEALLRAQAAAPSKPKGVPLVPVPRDGPLPLTYAQERLFFLDQLEPLSPDFNIVLPLRLRGPVQRERLAAAVSALVARHEALRTRFVVVAGEPKQLVQPAAPVPLPVVNVASEAELQARTREAISTGFALDRELPLRATLFTLSPTEHQLLLVLHNVVNDGQTLALLPQELAEHHAALEGKAPPLPPLAVQYGDVAVWERRRVEAGELEPTLAHWKRVLTPPPPPVSLAGAPPAVQTFGRALETLELEPALEAKLHALARAHGTTLFVVLEAAFFVLLHRYTQATDLCVGTPISPRRRTELEPLIGCFQNTLVLRAQVSPELTVTQLLEQLRAVTRDAFHHQDAPVDRVVRLAQASRSADHNPLFQHLVGLMPHPVQGALFLGEAKVEVEPMDVGRTRFELGLQVFEKGPGRGLLAAASYRTDLFDAAWVRRLLGHHRALLESMASTPERAVGRLPMLSPDERELQRAVLSTPPPPATPSVVETLERFARTTPNATAIRAGDVRWSFARLHDAATRVSAVLHARGLGAEAVVPVLAERGPWLLGAVAGILRAGAAFFLVDPRLPPKRIGELLAAVNATVLLGTEGKRELAPRTAAPEWISLETLPEAPGPTPTPPHPEQLAYVVFTSGSTGTPKGVMVTHRGLVNQLEAKRLDLQLGPNDAVEQGAGQAFDIVVPQLLAGPWAGGRSEVLSDAEAFDPEQLPWALDARGITVAYVPASVLSSAVEAMARGHRPRPRFESLRWLITGGEAIPPETCRRWLEATPRVPIINEYGPAECAVISTQQFVREAPRERTVPIGATIRGAHGVVSDAQGELVPEGVTGELAIGGAGVGRGYVNDPAKTAERFVPDPFATTPGARCYRTGDLVQWHADGALRFKGRADHQVKVRGVRIELGELESVIRALPGVAEAAVLLREKRLVAYVSGTGLEPPALKAQLSERLPEFMLPSAWVVLPKLPLNKSDKVDRAALPPPPTDDEVVQVPPRTPTEAALVALFGELLGRAAPGVTQDFFELGGHSLLVGRLVHGIAEKLGRTVSLRAPFEAPTAAALAALVDAAPKV